MSSGSTFHSEPISSFLGFDTDLVGSAMASNPSSSAKKRTPTASTSASNLPPPPMSDHEEGEGEGNESDEDAWDEVDVTVKGAGLDIVLSKP